jgi:hypothetical protein
MSADLTAYWVMHVEMVIQVAVYGALLVIVVSVFPLLRRAAAWLFQLISNPGRW